MMSDVGMDTVDSKTGKAVIKKDDIIELIQRKFHDAYKAQGKNYIEDAPCMQVDKAMPERGLKPGRSHKKKVNGVAPPTGGGIQADPAKAKQYSCDPSNVANALLKNNLALHRQFIKPRDDKLRNALNQVLPQCIICHSDFSATTQTQTVIRHCNGRQHQEKAQKYWMAEKLKASLGKVVKEDGENNGGVHTHKAGQVGFESLEEKRTGKAVLVREYIKSGLSKTLLTGELAMRLNDGAGFTLGAAGDLVTEFLPSIKRHEHEKLVEELKGKAVNQVHDGTSRNGANIEASVVMFVEENDEGPR